jgi:outer membrane receptor protein involved in Fe transport
MSWGLRKTLLAGAAIAAMSGGAAIADDEEERERETITVTGTRIQASGFNTPTPVATVTADELDLAAPGNIVTALVQLPQFFTSSTTSDPTGGFFRSPGTGNLDLRGLSFQGVNVTNRTLVLLDGRRLPASTRFGGTDINVLPEGMIQRVEAVTGGASAAYGSDAIAGVVNFILNTDFVGADAHAQYGITDRGDNENWEAGFAYGMDIGERGHIMFSGEKFEQEGVFTYEDREWYQQWGLVNGPAGGPERLVRPGVTSSTATLDGVISAGAASPLFNIEFLPDGSTRPFVNGPEGHNPAIPATSSAFRNLQSHTSGPGTSGTDNNVRPNVQPETSRESYFVHGDFDVTDSLNVYGQGMWGENDTYTSVGGGFYGAPFLPITIFSGNPYLPGNIQQIMTTNTIPSFTMQRVGSELDTAAESALITQNTMRQFTAGFDWEFLPDGLLGGDFFRNWTARGYYEDAQTSYNARQRGGLRLDRVSLALDAVRHPVTNEIVCRVNTEPFVTNNGGRWSDCVPINLFGRGNASPEAVDWVTGYDVGEQIDTTLEYTDPYWTSQGLTDSYLSSADKISSGEIDQTVFEVAFDGEIWKGWGAGPISGAVGYHYREESINQVVRDPANPTNVDAGTFYPSPGRPIAYDDAGCPGIPPRGVPFGVRGTPCFNVQNSVAIQFSKVPNVRGKLSTIEYFGELLVPVIADQPWMQQLNVSLQTRRADYTGTGEIWAWKYGADAQITDEFRFRATQSRDIRAASISERFDRVGGFGSVAWEPPCLNAASQPVNCSIFIVSGGNPEVDPETADTVTLGGVYQPNWLDGFSVSVDWYDIELSDAIAEIGAADIARECLAGDVGLCERISVDGSGLPVIINASKINLEAARVTGWDIEAAYRRDVSWFGGDESISARLFAGIQTENSRTTTLAGIKTDSSGNVLYPEEKVTASLTYNRGPLSLFLQERYTSETVNQVFYTEGLGEGGAPLDTIDDNSIEAVWYTDLNAAYRWDTSQGEVQLFGNVSNLLDEDPPIVANFANFGATAGQTGGGFDRLGRRYVVGVRIRR